MTHARCWSLVLTCMLRLGPKTNQAFSQESENGSKSAQTNKVLDAFFSVFSLEFAPCNLAMGSLHKNLKVNTNKAVNLKDGKQRKAPHNLTPHDLQNTALQTEWQVSAADRNTHTTSTSKIPLLQPLTLPSNLLQRRQTGHCEAKRSLFGV